MQHKVPEIDDQLAKTMAMAMEGLRKMSLFKPPAEILYWAESLRLLGVGELDPASVDRILGVVLVYQGDIDSLRTLALDGLVG